MKTINATLIALLLLTSFACENDDDEAEAAVANEEAAEMIATSLAADAGGLTEVLADASSNTTENGGGRKASCGYTESVDIASSNPAGAPITYSYTLHYDYALICANTLPTEMTANMVYNGVLDATRMSTDNSGTGDFSIKTLDNTYDHFTISGSYTRNGSFTSKVRNKNTSTSTLIFTLTDILVDKSIEQITGGTATVTITGSVTGKGGFTYAGNIIFEGNQLVSLDVNGNKYSIDLTTGVVTSL